jgi:hypothetical protein
MNPSNSSHQPTPNPEPGHESPGRPEAGWTPEELATIRRRRNRHGPFFFGEQVQDRLKALEKEWDRTGGFDKEYMEALLAQLDEGDPPHYFAYARK